MKEVVEWCGCCGGSMRLCWALKVSAVGAQMGCCVVGLEEIGLGAEGWCCGVNLGAKVWVQKGKKWMQRG